MSADDGRPSRSGTWVIPGAPLEHGEGWRIWYSCRGTELPRPALPTVRLNGQEQELRPTDEWEECPPFRSLERRMGVLTVRLAAPVPGALYEVEVPEAGRVFRWRTLPDSLDPAAIPGPGGGPGRPGVAFLFASCFWQPNDKDGAYSAAVQELFKIEQPVFKLLIGDQVYQDYPPNWLPAGDPLTRCAERYERYWGDAAYQALLQASPNFFVCDDHEFWNDYPECQVHIPYTWSADARAANGEVASALYVRYQAVANPAPHFYYSFSVGPVSIFVSDSRSQRTEHDVAEPRFFPPDEWEALTAWAHGLTGPGVLVLGQPLFGKLGDWKDHTLANFEDDFSRLCAVFEDALVGGDGRPPHDILILTGDIHRARYSVATIGGIPGTADVHELVASPASRVGPYIRPPDPHVDPTTSKFDVMNHGEQRTWTVKGQVSEKIPSVDNNVGLVRMSTGTNGRVRFDLSIWRVRPYDSRSVVRRLLRRHQPQGDLVKLWEREIELR